ncbi:MAG: hypothetical protein KF802_03595 [Bdellovibrionaceae bacterium]|nr:hypothetical protein [Pseudobdellovibrionaceae bacterium]MBX3033294.1 hypothetical protein [Pseudobdellovibrionaceae bacterium]
MKTAKPLIFSDALIEKTMRPLQEGFFELPWAEKDFYMDFLVHCFHVQSSFGQVLSQTEEACRRRAGGLWRDFYAHIRQEAGRADLAFRDVRALGGNPESRVTLPLAAALWEPQLTKLLQQPSAPLGFIFAWENLAVMRFSELLDLVVTLYGEEASHYVRSVVDSAQYLAEASLDRIRHLPEAELPAVISNFMQTCQLMEALFWFKLK